MSSVPYTGPNRSAERISDPDRSGEGLGFVKPFLHKSSVFPLLKRDAEGFKVQNRLRRFFREDFDKLRIGKILPVFHCVLKMNLRTVLGGLMTECGLVPG